MAKKIKKSYNNSAINSTHYGYPDVNDITVGSRFFFFQTLQNSSEGQSVEAGNYRMNVYNKALDILNSNNLNMPKENEGESQIQAALNFLKAAIDYQQAHERTIWEQVVLQILKGTEYEKMAQACFPPGSNTINYNDFINILGLIETDLQDKNRWARQLQQTYNEVIQFNNEISAINHGLNANPVTLNAFGPNALISRIYKNGYGDRRELAAATKSMLDSRVLDRALLGSTRSQFFSSLAIDLNSIIDQLLRQSAPKVTLTYQDANNLRLGFSAEIAHEMLNIFYDSLKDEQGSGILDKISYHEFEKMFFTITDNGAKEIKAEQLQKLIKKGKQLLSNIKLLEQQGENIRKTPNERVTISKSTGELVGINKAVRSRLQQVLSDQTSIAQFLKQSEKTDFRSATARKKFLQELKQYLAPLIESDPIKQKALTNTHYQNYINQLLSYNSTFTIYDETEYAGAHALSHILKSPKFHQAIALKVIGNDLGKTDVSGMIIPLGKLRLGTQINKTKFAHAFIEQNERLFNSAYQERREAIKKQTENKLFTQANSFSAQAQHEALKKAQENLQNTATITATIKKAKIKESKTNNIKAIQQQLKQALYIDETTKFSEKNFKDYGFKGGSLGANIDEQIENITWMLGQGGITPADKDWLIFATLNSGQHLLGNFLRSSLEDYFSTVASLLLFRSGGNVAEQVAQLNVKQQDNYIRIYRLGSLFVPNSFILKLTYDALTEANAEIAHSAYGSRAMIHNNVSKPVGRRKQKNQSSDKTIGVWQWAETYSANYHKVQINLQILGGFLDIIQKLKQRLNQF